MFVQGKLLIRCSKCVCNLRLCFVVNCDSEEQPNITISVLVVKSLCWDYTDAVSQAMEVRHKHL